MDERSSKQRTSCDKIPIRSSTYAESLAKIKAEEWGLPTRVHPCKICHALHITTTRKGSGRFPWKGSRSTSKKNQNQPETMKMQRRRYKLRRKARERLPIETWEDDGGFIPEVHDVN